MERRAKLFVTGGSQAVRLPKDCRFEGTEVRVQKVGCAVVLEPVDGPGWPAGFWKDMPLLDDAWERPDDPPPAPLGQASKVRPPG